MVGSAEAVPENVVRGPFPGVNQEARFVEITEEDNEAGEIGRSLLLEFKVTN